MKSIDLTKTIPLNMLLFTDNTFETLVVDFSFTLVTEAESESVDHMVRARIDQNSSFTKIVTFVESILNETVVFDVADSEFVSEHFAHLQNNFMMLPSVSEMIIIAALHYKLNSIISDNSIVTTITLNEKTQNLTFNYTFIDDGEGYGELPNGAEWCPELSYWKDPWWCREDITTIDRIAATQEEYDKWIAGDKITVEKSSRELLASIDDQYKDLFSEDDEIKEGDLIEVDFNKNQQWGPKLVD